MNGGLLRPCWLPWKAKNCGFDPGSILASCHKLDRLDKLIRLWRKAEYGLEQALQLWSKACFILGWRITTSYKNRQGKKVIRPGRFFLAFSSSSVLHMAADPGGENQVLVAQAVNFMSDIRLAY